MGGSKSVWEFNSDGMMIHCSIIYWHFDEGWTVAHLQAALAEHHEMVKTIDRRVDAILDISDGGLLPTDLMRFIRYYRPKSHSSTCLKIVIGANEYLQLFWRNVAPLAPGSWHLTFAVVAG